MTVTALGGNGKTRVALRVAEEVSDAYRDGVWLVELDGLSPGAEMTGPLATTLGIAARPDQSPADAVLAYLKPRQVLLLLDAAEGALRDVRALVPQLLTGCPGVSVLTTSRVPLGLAAEIVWPLPPLAVPDGSHDDDPVHLLENDSARLFVERAASVRLGYTATSGDAPAIGRICRRLGGIPLAIELAAARLKVLSPAKLADRLEERLGTTVGASADASARERTLTDTIEWSWRQLGADEQALCFRLALFPGGASLDAVEAVCDDDQVALDSVLDVLSRLLDKSLIVYDERAGDPRYRMLDPIREFAVDRLDESGQREAVTKAFISWARAFAQQVAWSDTGPEHQRWLERADVEIANLRAAFTVSCANNYSVAVNTLVAQLNSYLMIRGRYDEARTWFAEAIRLQQNEGGRRNLRVLKNAGDLALAMSDLDEAERLYRDAAEGPEGDSEDWRASAALALGGIARVRGDLVEFRRCVETGLALARAEGDVITELGALNDLGYLDWMAGDLDAARATFEDIRARCVAAGDRRRASHVLVNIVAVAIEQCDENAHTLALELIAACREFGDRETLGYGLLYLGIVCCQQGRHADGLGPLTEAESIFRDLGMPPRRADVCAAMAEVLVADDDTAGAVKLCVEGLRLARDCDDLSPAIELLRVLASLWAGADAETAMELLGGSAAVAEFVGNMPTPAWAKRDREIRDQARATAPGADLERARGIGAARSAADAVTHALSLGPPPQVVSTGIEPMRPD